MGIGRWLGPGVLVAVGVVWILQGLGVLRSRSFMTDDVRWAVIGVVLVGVGAAIAFRRRRPA